MLKIKVVMKTGYAHDIVKSLCNGMDHFEKYNCYVIFLIWKITCYVTLQWKKQCDTMVQLCYA